MARVHVHDMHGVVHALAPAGRLTLSALTECGRVLPIVQNGDDDSMFAVGSDTPLTCIRCIANLLWEESNESLAERKSRYL